MKPMNPKRCLFAMALVHLSVVPITLVATQWAFGAQDSLTLENQVTWSPVFGAQKVLLAIVVGLGAGAFSKRISIWIVGVIVIIVSTNIVRASIVTYGPSFFETMLLCCLRDLPNALPSLGVAIALVTMRRRLGVIGNQVIHRNESQFTINDMFVLLTVVAAIAAVCRWVIGDTRIPDPNFAALSVEGCGSLVSTVGAVLLTLSARFRWLGLLMLFAAIMSSVLRLSAVTPLWFAVAAESYRWTLVVLTLVSLYGGGFRLQVASGLHRNSTAVLPGEERTSESNTLFLAVNMA